MSTPSRAKTRFREWWHYRWHVEAWKFQMENLQDDFNDWRNEQIALDAQHIEVKT